MGETTLVDGQIEDSIALVQKLDSLGDCPTFAVWHFYSDASEWRLLIAGPSFEALLPKQEPVAYRKIAEAMAAVQLTSLGISLVKVVSNQAALPTAVRFLIRTDPKGIVRAHFTDTTLNGIFIKEMIVLRST